MVEEKTIKFLQFSILSPDEIRRISVLKIDSDLTFEKNYPKKGGLMDQRLGAIDKELFCQTDLASYIDCPGYFGHLELNKPIFHEGFMNFLLLILRCIDHTTSKLLANQKSNKIKNLLRIKNPRKRLFLLSKISISACNSNKNKKINDEDLIEENTPLQPKYSKDGWCIIAKFDKKLTSEPTRILTAERIFEIFKKISDNDCKKIGLNPSLSRPDWMILTVLPIPPPTIRPSVIFDLTSRAEDDLTYKLGDIVRTNQSLYQSIISGAPLQIINDQTNLLQYHVGSYMNNNVPNLPKSLQKSGRAIKSLRERLQGKEGRVRGNLMGKRVDFSARTVITPDPNLKLDEIGIPWSIALNLTYPEIVTPFNVELLLKIVHNGPYSHPGAKYIIRNDGSRIDLRYVKNISDIHLEIGFQVERHLQDGDVVLFNRQPSLHKMSMMGHVIKIMHYSTFRMNLSATSPYNADFDGDEMNLHLPQTIEAKTELLNLLMVPNCIISQQGNKPVMGIVQDSLIGSLLLTQKDTFIKKTEVMLLLMEIDNWNGEIPVPSILKPVELWTGKQLISMVFPKINLKRTSLNHIENDFSIITHKDSRVFIKRGQLLSGIIDKRTVGSSAGSLIHVSWKEFGPEKTTDFISNFQILVNAWLNINGFSVGIGDTLPDKKLKKHINNTIRIAKSKVKKILKTTANTLGNNLNKKVIQTSFENQINKILNSARDNAGSNAQKVLPTTNNIKRMVICGSKGSFINISQIIACVGQQNVEGKRIPLGFNFRSLPHFSFENSGPETRGFVENSYITGLRPDEFFFHSMGGREGLIDTAIKTSETGYIQRRLSKAMEDVTVEYDLTVRNGQNCLLEFFYGDDSMDAANLEIQYLRLAKISDKEVEMVYKINPDSPCLGLTKKGISFSKKINNLRKKKFDKLIEKEYFQILRDREILRQSIYVSNENSFPLPVNIDRIIWNGQNIFTGSKMKEKPDPFFIIKSIKLVENFLLNSIEPKRNSECFENCICDLCENKMNATMLFRIYLRSSLALKLVLQKYKLCKNSFKWILCEICNQFRKSIIHPGEMVGTVSAQSIGQPATQMTLNTFHYAGVSAKNVTLGVPRLKEIISVLKTVKTPSLTIYLFKECSSSPYRVKKLQQSLEFLTVQKIEKNSNFFYDPDPYKTIFSKDRDCLENYFEIPDESLSMQHLGTWTMTITLKENEFVDKKLSIDQLIEKIKKKSKPLPLFIINSDENSGLVKLLFKVFWPELKWNHFFDIKENRVKKVNLFSYEKRYLMRMKHFLSNINIKDFGTPNIKKVFIRKTDLNYFNLARGGGILNKKEFVLDTEGVDLRYIFNYIGVDFSRSISNDILEICRILGIEATRKVLINELKNLISFDGSYVNSRHLFLLVDIMTFRGKLMSITRHGINKTDVGPIAKCSFEETVDIFYQSAVFGVCDNLKGVSANILVGNLAPLGTGKIDLFFSDKL
mmetsp:Transcript_28017/g.66858  ORF Transcript_28017/g.66858 Transcript_28017/m.66858 type:complete len:1463 (-) Transcript_28017:1142-5530(-)